MSLPQHHYVTKEYRNPVTWEVYTDICLERGPQYVRSTKRRSIFLPLNRYVTKRHIHPVTGEAFTNVCLEQGSSSSWSDDSLRAPKRMRIHRAPRKGFHGTPTLCDQRRCLGSLDDMQGNTDVLVVGDVSGTLHGITPTLVDSTAATASSNTPPPAAAGSSPPRAAKKSTTTGSAFPTPTGSTAGVDGTMPLRLAREQFSTREQVAMYHRIMSEQFIVGQQVWVKYGTNHSEFWFPAAIHLQNLDGTYQIIYQDLDESDPTASKKPPERIKADCDSDCDNSYYRHDVEYSNSDDYDNDYNDANKVNSRSPTKAKAYRCPSSDELMDGKITQFPLRRGSFYHPFRSRLRVDTTVFVKRSLDGPVLTGVIRQIMQDPQNKERFRYFIRSKPHFPQYYEEIWEEDFLTDSEKGTRWATRSPLPSTPAAEVPQPVSCSSTHSDVYLLLTKEQAQKAWPPLTCWMYDFTRGRTERERIIAEFKRRCCDPQFILQQQKFLRAMSTAVNSYVGNLSESVKPPRLGWAVWVPSKHGELWHLFQLTALLVSTNGTGDEVVKKSIGELFMHVSSVCAGKKFDNPFTFALDPLEAFLFLTARARGSAVSSVSSGITCGLNYGNTKAHNLIKIAKQLIVFKYCQLQHRNLHDVVEDIGECYTHGSLLPLPAYIVDNVPDTVALFPECYDEKFLDSLHGVGLKIRHLLAEAGYKRLQVGRSLHCTTPNTPCI
jgi:hypothetical protein